MSQVKYFCQEYVEQLVSLKASDDCVSTHEEHDVLLNQLFCVTAVLYNADDTAAHMCSYVLMQMTLQEHIFLHQNLGGGIRWQQELPGRALSCLRGRSRDRKHNSHAFRQDEPSLGI